MSDENTQIKDLTEIERIVVGSSLNFVYNLFNNQIYHIENHDPELIEILRTNEIAQEDFILLQNFKDITLKMSELFGSTFVSLPEEELEGLMNPAIKLERFFQEVFQAIICNGEE